MSILDIKFVGDNEIFEEICSVSIEATILEIINRAEEEICADEDLCKVVRDDFFPNIPFPPDIYGPYPCYGFDWRI